MGITRGGGGNMTVANCADACAAGNYIFAGVEYGNEVSIHSKSLMARVTYTDYGSAGAETRWTSDRCLPPTWKTNALSHAMETPRSSAAVPVD